MKKLNITKDTSKSTLYRHKDKVGYWIGHFYFKVLDVHFQPGEFQFYGKLSDLINLIHKGIDIGYLYTCDISSEDVRCGMEENGYENWEEFSSGDGEESWDVTLHVDKPEYWDEEFDLVKNLQEHEEMYGDI